MTSENDMSVIEFVNMVMAEDNSWTRGDQLLALRRRDTSASERAELVAHLTSIPRTERDRFVELHVLMWADRPRYEKMISEEVTLLLAECPGEDELSWLLMVNAYLSRRRRFAPQPSDVDWVIEALGRALEILSPSDTGISYPFISYPLGIVEHLSTLPLLRTQALEVVELACRSLDLSVCVKQIQKLFALRFDIPNRTDFPTRHQTTFTWPKKWGLLSAAERVAVLEEVRALATSNLHLVDEVFTEPYLRYGREVLKGEQHWYQQGVQTDRDWLDVVEPERSRFIAELKAEDSEWGDGRGILQAFEEDLY